MTYLTNPTSQPVSRRQLRAQREAAQVTALTSTESLTGHLAAETTSIHLIPALLQQISVLKIERDSATRLYNYATQNQPGNTGSNQLLVTETLQSSTIPTDKQDNSTPSALELGAAHTKVAAVEELLAAKTRELHDTAADLAHLTTENQQLKTELQAALSQIADLTDMVADKDTELTDKARLIADFETRIGHLTAEISSIRHVAKTEIAALNNQLTETRIRLISETDRMDCATAQATPATLSQETPRIAPNKAAITNTNQVSKAAAPLFTDEEFVAFLKTPPTSNPSWLPVTAVKENNTVDFTYPAAKQHRFATVGKRALLGAAVALVAGGLPISLPVVASWLTPAVAEQPVNPELPITGATIPEPEIYQYTDTNMDANIDSDMDSGNDPDISTSIVEDKSTE